MPIPPWQLNQPSSSFPIPPRNVGGLFNLPVSNRDLQSAQNITIIGASVPNVQPIFAGINKAAQLITSNVQQIYAGVGKTGGILDNSFGRRPVVVADPTRRISQTHQSYIADSPRQTSSQAASYIGDSPRPVTQQARDNGRPGILDSSIDKITTSRSSSYGAPNRAGGYNRDRDDKQRNGPRERQGYNKNATPPSGGQKHDLPNTNNRPNISPNINNKSNNSQNENKSNNSPNVNNKQNNYTPKGIMKNSKNEAVNKELEEKALKFDVTKEFFERIKSLTNHQIANLVALEYAQKEHAANKKIPYTGKSTGVGHHMCNICKINHLSAQKLQGHYKSKDHKDLEDLFDVKKEQVRLIMDNKITGPIAKPSETEADMIAIARAEVEMNIKPGEIDLDAYILGVYESIMKPYWPVPQSSFYCRICNYAEFKTERDLENHRLTREHTRREDNYQEAFCLYCQKHTGDIKRMGDHEKNSMHIKIKDLMERTKQCAIEHWHKVNKKELPDKYAKSLEEKAEEKKNEDEKADPKVGSKRSAPNNDKEYSSPSKKVSTSSKDYSKDSGKDSTKDYRKDTPRDSGKDSSKTSVKDSAKDLAKNSIKNSSKDFAKDSSKDSTKDSSKDATKSHVKDSGRDSSKERNKDSNRRLSTSESKTSSNKQESESSTSSKEPVIPDSDSIWFAPIFGFMCKACHKFLANSREQKLHISDPAHSEAIAKFKKSITG